MVIFIFTNVEFGHYLDIINVENYTNECPFPRTKEDDEIMRRILEKH